MLCRARVRVASLTFLSHRRPPRTTSPRSSPSPSASARSPSTPSVPPPASGPPAESPTDLLRPTLRTADPPWCVSEQHDSVRPRERQGQRHGRRASDGQDRRARGRECRSGVENVVLQLLSLSWWLFGLVSADRGLAAVLGEPGGGARQRGVDPDRRRVAAGRKGLLQALMSSAKQLGAQFSQTM